MESNGTSLGRRLGTRNITWHLATWTGPSVDIRILPAYFRNMKSIHLQPNCINTETSSPLSSQQNPASDMSGSVPWYKTTPWTFIYRRDSASSGVMPTHPGWNQSLHSSHSTIIPLGLTCLRRQLCVRACVRACIYNNHHNMTLIY